MVLEGLSSIRTSFGDRIDIFYNTMAKETMDECWWKVRDAFGESASDFGEEVSPELEERLERGGFYAGQRNAYYLRPTPYGTNMLEINPWGHIVYAYAVSLHHVPENHVQGVDRSRHRIKSLEEYRILMRAASLAEAYEIRPKLLMNAVVSGDLRDIIEKILQKEWKLIAASAEKTPPRYQTILDRIDPLFRLSGQSLYAKREGNGICIAVCREHSDDRYTSVVAYYIPDCFRFTDIQAEGATGVLGICKERLGLMITREDVGNLIRTLKKEL